MRWPYVFPLALLLTVALLLAMVAVPAAAKDLVTIPLNKEIEVTPGIYADLLQVTISDTGYGSVYTPDPSKVIYPDVSYVYDNRGTVAQKGHLHVRFVDDQGQSYEADDPGTLYPVYPGNKSAARFLEVAIPKERTVTELVVVMGFEEQTIKLNYPATPTPAGTPTPATSASASPKGNACIGSMVLPLLLVGMAWAGQRIARK